MTGDGRGDLSLLKGRSLADASHNVGGQITFGAFEKLELHGFAFVQSPVAVFLDGGEVDEDVLSGRALNEPITFGAIEPLNCALLSHVKNSFRLSSEIKILSCSL